MKNETQYNPPVNWGKDPVSQFIDSSEKNAHATFANMPKEFNLIVSCDELFRLGIECSSHSKHWFENFFFLKSHSAFLCGARLSMSAETSELPMVLRGSLEWSLYGHFFHNHQDLAETWLNLRELREKDPNVVYKFSRKRLLKCLQDKSSILGEKAEKLYDYLIEAGAHPNELSLSSTTNMEKINTNVFIKNFYLSSSPDGIKYALSNTYHVGYCCLRIWELLLKERFEIMGISQKLDKLGI